MARFASAAGRIDSAREMIRVRALDITWDGVADNSAALALACEKRKQVNVAAVLLDVSKMRLNSDVDCQGAKIVGSGTIISGTGRLLNNGGISGAEIAGINQDVVIRVPAVMQSAGISPKVVYKIGADDIRIIAKRARNGGYVGMRVIKNNWIASGSVGVAGELWRCIHVQNISKAYVYKRGGCTTGGTWADLNIPLSSGGTGVPYKVYSTQEAGAYIEFPFSGYVVDLGLYVSSGGNPSIDIYIDGEIVETISTIDPTGQVKVKRYMVATGGEHTIRVQKPSAGGFLYVAGVNIASIADIEPEGVDVDTLAYAVAGATVGDGAARDYVINSGAQDYAFHDGIALAGSIHGGEYSDYVSWRADGIAFDPADFAAGQIVAVGRSITLHQRTNFGWDAERRFDTESLTDWTSDGGWTFSCQMKARPEDGIELYSAYTSMTTTNTIFSDVEFPIKHTVDPNNTKTPIGRTEYVRQRNPATGDVVESFMTVSDVEDSRFGGAYVWGSTPSYNKVYYGPVIEGRLNIKQLAFVTRKQFS